MSPEEVLKKCLEYEPDFVAMKKYHYSVREMIERHPNGCDDYSIAKALGLKESQVRAMWARVVVKLRKEMGVERGDLGRG